MPEDESSSSKSNLNWMKRHPLVTYFVLAIGITSICWVPTGIIASMRGYTLPSPVSFGELIQSGFEDTPHAVISVIFSFGVYGPLLAAVIVTTIENGKAGLRELFGRIIKWRVGIRWYLALLVLPLIIYIPSVLVGVLLGLSIPSPLELAVPLQYFIPFVLYQVFTSGLEEPGWRGYALPKLQTKYNAEKSSGILGILWSLWHWPFLIIFYYSTAIVPPDVPLEMTGIILAATTAQQLFLHALSTVGMAIIFTWFYNNTKSILICILFHVSINVTGIYIQGFLPHPSLAVITGIMPWVVAIILFKIFGKERLSRKPTS